MAITYKPQLRYPDLQLYIRNMCDGGDTPGFRPHSGRVSPWAFPGAEKFQTELARKSGSEGHFETPDQWITRHKADVLLAQTGTLTPDQARDVHETDSPRVRWRLGYLVPAVTSAGAVGA